MRPLFDGRNGFAVTSIWTAKPPEDPAVFFRVIWLSAAGELWDNQAWQKPKQH
jgi:hypothetical protein